ncbi:MAG: DEAD/DEAH box helicase [Saprospiraceae bacterium]
MARKKSSHWFYDKRPAPRARAGSYRRAYGTSWWGKQFLAAVEEASEGGRLARGKTYANKGLVENLEQPAPGELTAEVQGSMPYPYEVGVSWQPWSAEEGRAVVAEVKADPALLGQLLTGNLPEGLNKVLERLGLTIFPKNMDELGATCSCPDYGMPCKHMAALFFVMAGAIDNDPFYLFQLRGLDLKAALPSGPGEEAEEDDSEIFRLDDLIQEVAGAPVFQWDEEVYQTLDFGSIKESGWRAVSRLPSAPPFDGATGGDFLEFTEKIYQTAARHADKLWRRDNGEPVAAAELLPPGGQVELHLNENLRLHGLSSFDAEDLPLLEIEGAADILAWLQDTEQLDRHLLDKQARSLLLFFQLARTLVRRRAYVPRLLAVGKDEYLLQYAPATADEKLRETLEQCYRLASPTLLYYVDMDEEFFEFRARHDGEQLVAALMGAIIGQATAKLTAENPVRELFLLHGRRRFELLGTEGYPAAINRWLNQLYLAEQRYGPVFKIEEEGDGLRVEVLVDDREAKRKGPPPPLEKWLAEAATADRLRLIKTLSFLGAHFPDLTAYLSNSGREPMYFSVGGFTPVLTAVLPSMEALGIRVLLPAALRKLLRPGLGLSASSASAVFELSGIISLDNILKFDWQTALGDQVVSAEEFRDLLENSTGLVKFRESYVMLEEGEVARLLKKLNEDQPDLKAHERLAALFTEEYEGGPVSLSKDLRSLVDKLRGRTKIALPGGLEATLRPYQLRGYEWLYANAALGFGSVLADDMGLGKTLQVITLLLKYAEEGKLDREKALVIVPTSLLGNWQREIERFAPGLRTSVYHGTGRQLPDPADHDVLLTTYGVARSEEAMLAKMPWRIQVIDEAQNIKNPAAKQSKAVKKIAAPVRIAMSGTPVENRLLDYWSLLDFTLPKFMGSRKYFNENYGRPIQGERDQRVAERFQKLTAPFVLRRLKTDKTIITDLPDKVVQTEICRLTPEQTALYESILKENMRLVEDADSGIGRQGLILKLITALKQCCNHPAQFLKSGAADFARSGKGLLLRERLTSILENNDKAIIFTQYREMGELLQTMIGDTFGHAVPFLHGGTSTKARDEMVDRFQTDGDCPLLLISIKAGGTGLNLTAANHVIHYDLWWNPAVENQATDRAYRIGQENTVFVHRLVTERTFEEKIDELIHSKREIADLSVAEGEASIGKLSNGELRELVGLGASLLT